MMVYGPIQALGASSSLTFRYCLPLSMKLQFDLRRHLDFTRPPPLPEVLLGLCMPAARLH